MTITLDSFSEDQIKALERFQKGPFHPFTHCCSDGVSRILVPKENGLHCPCGNYKQNWVHDFMVDEKFIIDMEDEFKNFDAL